MNVLTFVLTAWLSIVAVLWMLDNFPEMIRAELDTRKAQKVRDLEIQSYRAYQLAKLADDDTLMFRALRPLPTVQKPVHHARA